MSFVVSCLGSGFDKGGRQKRVCMKPLNPKPCPKPLNPQPSEWVVVKIRVPFGYPKQSVPYYINDPKRDPTFDNHPDNCLTGPSYRGPRDLHYVSCNGISEGFLTHFVL